MPLFGSPNIDKLKAKKDVPRLIKTLSHRDSRVRWAAATALGELGDTQAVEGLLSALNHPDEGVRVAVMTALGESKDVRAVTPLVSLLSNKSGEVRKAAVLALNKILPTAISQEQPPMESVVEGLLAALNDREMEVAVLAAKLLGSMKITQAVTPLIGLLSRGSFDVIKAAATALGQIGDSQAFEPLVKQLIVIGTAKEVGSALAEIDAQRAVPILSSALFSSRDSDKCVAVAHALGHTRDAQAIEPLAQAIDRFAGSPSVAQAAVSALGEIGRELTDSPERQRVIEILQEVQRKQSGYQNIRDQAMWALNSMAAKTKGN